MEEFTKLVESVIKGITTAHENVTVSRKFERTPTGVVCVILVTVAPYPEAVYALCTTYTVRVSE